jgi:hypothetical protein
MTLSRTRYVSSLTVLSVITLGLNACTVKSDPTKDNGNSAEKTTSGGTENGGASGNSNYGGSGGTNNKAKGSKTINGGTEATESEDESEDSVTSDEGGSGGVSSTDGTTKRTTTNNAVQCTIGGYIDTAFTLAPNPDCPNGYRVKNNVKVAGLDAVLTIAPGTVLKFDAGVGIAVTDSGTIRAIGTKDAPILFTGWQETPGAWDGIYVTSESMKNEISNATIEFAGAAKSEHWGAITVGNGEVASKFALSFVKMQKNGYFGLSVASYAILSKFDNNEILENVKGAMRAVPSSIAQFRGNGNRIQNNGGNNTVRVVAAKMTVDATWPNLAPAAYRVVAEYDSDTFVVGKHLTLEPGTVIEFSPGTGIDVLDANAGLSAVGTSDAPIILRGIDDNGWLGITFAQTNWTGNTLENVRVKNAFGAPISFESTTIGNGSPGLTSIAIGQLVGTAAYLRVKNITLEGPNAATNDFSVTAPAKLVIEGINHGAAADGNLKTLNLAM